MPDPALQGAAELEAARRIRQMADRLVAESPTPLTVTEAVDIVVTALRSMGSEIAARVIEVAESQAATRAPGPNRAQRRAAARRGR